MFKDDRINMTPFITKIEQIKIFNFSQFRNGTEQNRNKINRTEERINEERNRKPDRSFYRFNVLFLNVRAIRVKSNRV